MKPTELQLFTTAEQELLVATEKHRLAELSEDEIDDLLTRVRRARNKYMKLYRRQSAANVADNQSRAGTDTSNQRTNRKAEILEDALARVARALAAAARATAKQLKDERLAAAAAAKGSPVTQRSAAPGSAADTGSKRREPTKGPTSSAARQGSKRAAGARKQAKRDSR